MHSIMVYNKLNAQRKITVSYVAVSGQTEIILIFTVK